MLCVLLSPTKSAALHEQTATERILAWPRESHSSDYSIDLYHVNININTNINRNIILKDFSFLSKLLPPILRLNPLQYKHLSVTFTHLLHVFNMALKTG